MDLPRHGPDLPPGDTLEAHVTPVTCETVSLDVQRPDLFATRFWRDGTARLTAYEYLGVTQSPCFAGGEPSCGTCHTMHGGDVHGMIEPAKRGDGACTQCHAKFARRAHHGHEPSGAGGRCLACHMPRIVYGILDVHRSHRIESPDVRRDVEAGRPNACTHCHAGASAAWAAEGLARITGRASEPPRSRPDGGPLELPEVLVSLHAGDAVQRAVAARALGELPDARAAAFVVPHLVVALGDGYPSVRTLARRALVALERELGLGLAREFAAFDPLAPLEVRGVAVRDLLARAAVAARAAGIPPPPAGTLVGPDHELDLARVRALLERQIDHVIAIGE